MGFILLKSGDHNLTKKAGKKSESMIALPHEVGDISRRQILKSGISMTAYASLAKSLFSGSAKASTVSHPVQKKLIWISMSGGWDILETTDPKVSSTSGIDMIYDWNDANRLNGSNVRIGRYLPQLASHGQDIVVVNGITMQTTSHSAGRLYMDTGVLSNSGTVNAASIPSIVASESSATIPIIQLSGGADPLIDRGLLNPVSVVRAGNLSLYRDMYPTDQDEIDRKMMLIDFMRNSVNSLRGKINSSSTSNDDAIDRIKSLSAAGDKIRNQFQDNVGQRLVLTETDRAIFELDAPDNMRRNMQETFALTLKLITNDVVDVVNLGIGGFDTHSNQTTRLRPNLERVDYLVSNLVQGLKNANMLDDVLIVMYSDFGRTPKINNSNGRDHWPTGGAFLIGGGLDGGRVVGGSDDNLRSLIMNQNTGVTDSSLTVESGNNILLKPEHLGGSILELCLGAGYDYRTYLPSIPALTRLKS